MYKLSEFNTFGVQAYAAELVVVSDAKELSALGGVDPAGYLILGGGSNVLFRSDTDRTVLKNEIRGFEVVDDSDSFVVVRVGGGEIWHDTVMRCCDAGFGGIENLALIPGTVGAAPVQNIGAYGVELADVFHRADTVELATGRARSFSAEECNFGYRSSFFKEPENRGRFFITSVELRLSKSCHRLVTHYGKVAEMLEGLSDPTISDVAEAVIDIRSSKLPDPKVLGNAGSFFKNPVMTRTEFDAVADSLADGSIVNYPAGFDVDGNELVKVAAGWLVESLGWKGKRVGNTGTYEHQALIIVNHGGASGAEIWDHAQRIAQSVSDRYGIELEPEVNII